MITQKNKIKVLVIVGQTASGKSDLAVEVARKYGGEIISADSRQVYKGLDIGSGKITKKEMKNVPHHMLSIVGPSKVFTVADFVRESKNIIRNIAKEGRLPIITGGTMFYIDALIGAVDIPKVPPNKTLRHKLEKMGSEELLKILKKKDIKRARMFEKDGQHKNKRRIIRAIEVSNDKNDHKDSVDIYQTLKIGIKPEKQKLRNRIKLRTKKRVKRGMIAEAKNLHKKGLSYKRMRELGLEYGHLADYLQNKITKEELIWRIERDDWRYARKQMSWWKRDDSIVWIPEGKISLCDKAIKNFFEN